MSISERFKAVGGSAQAISTCQEELAKLVDTELQCPEDVKVLVREFLLGRAVRTKIAQCLLDTYIEGLKIGRGERG